MWVGTMRGMARPNPRDIRHLQSRQNAYGEPVNDVGLSTQRLHCIDCGEEKGSGHGAAVAGAWDHPASRQGWVQTHEGLSDAQRDLRSARRVRPGRPADPQKVSAANAAARAAHLERGNLQWEQFGGGAPQVAPQAQQQQQQQQQPTSSTGDAERAQRIADRRAERMRDRRG